MSCASDWKSNKSDGVLPNCKKELIMCTQWVDFSSHSLKPLLQQQNITFACLWWAQFVTWPCHRHKQAGTYYQRPQGQVTISSRLPRKRHALTLLSAALGDHQCTGSTTPHWVAVFWEMVLWTHSAAILTSLPNTIYTNYLYRLPLQRPTCCCLLPALAYAKKPGFHLPDTRFHPVLGSVTPWASSLRFHRGSPAPLWPAGTLAAQVVTAKPVYDIFNSTYASAKFLLKWHQDCCYYIIKMTHIFYLYQMQKIKEVLKGHSILHSLSIVSTSKSLKSIFNEAALLAELSTVIKFVCTAFRSVVSETAETMVYPQVFWQAIVIRALKVCCTSTADCLDTPCHILRLRECLGMCALG